MATAAKQWYIIRAYSGHEDKVAEEIKQRIDNLNLTGKVGEILVPKEKQVELKNGQRRVVEKRIFQGYVMIEMELTDDVWFTIRNTPSVSGFVGTDGKPVPVENWEVDQIKKRMQAGEPKHKIDYRPGDVVLVTDGPFRDHEGSIADVDPEKGKIKVLINVFGRETPMELDALQVKRP